MQGSQGRARSAIVVGGSLGGLVTARLLKGAGWRVKVFERVADDLSGRGAGLASHDELTGVLARVGIRVDESLGVTVSERVAIDRAGSLLGTLAYRQVMTSWNRLYELLREGLQPAEYVQGRRLVEARNVPDGAEAVLDDGSVEAADLVVGADGMRSTLRAQLIAPEVQPVYAGYVAWRGRAPMAAVAPLLGAGLAGKFICYIGAGEQLIGYPVPAGSGTDADFNFVWYHPCSLDQWNDLCTDAQGRNHFPAIAPPLIRPEVLARMRDHARAVLSPELAAAFERTEAPFFQPIYDLESPRLVAGRCALVGDAAFVARPHCGMGVTKAASDALALVQCLQAQPDDVDAALAAYERQRQPEGQAMVAHARALARFIHWTPSHGGVPAHVVAGVLSETAVPPQHLLPQAQAAMQALPPPAEQALRQLLGERYVTAAAVREQHGRGESYHPSAPPAAVLYPASTEEVAAIVRVCNEHRVPVVAFGAGTSLEGNTAALAGGVCLDMRQMNRVLGVNPEDMDAVAQAGVTRKELNAHLGGTGLFFSVDPGADATLGGMAATRASGTTAVRYGTMRDNVLGLTVVTASGEIVHTARRARKSAAGLDLTRLFVGSEGTLGIITEVTVRLHPLPEAVTSAVCAFETLHGAVNAVISVLQCAIPIARIELLDAVMMDAVNRRSGYDYPVRPTLFFEFHGTEAGAAEQAGQAADIAREHGGGDFRWAAKPEDRSRLWQARHDTLYASLALKPGSQALVTDVCVPISRLADCIVETRADIEASGLLVPMVGHVGDGNFHCLVLIDPNDEADVARAHAFNDRLVHRALRFEGSCTGEHGIGYGKLDFLRQELGNAVDVMRSVKAALDPRGILNPGKIYQALPVRSPEPAQPTAPAASALEATP